MMPSQWEIQVRLGSVLEYGPIRELDDTATIDRRSDGSRSGCEILSARLHGHDHDEIWAVTQASSRPRKMP